MPNGEPTVCAWPASLANNATHDMLYAELRALGVRVLPYRQPGILSERFDVLHVHWPDTWLHYRSPLRAWLRTRVEFYVLAKLKRRGVKIVWTVHNLRSHEGRHPLQEADFWKRFPKMADGYIVLTAASREPVVEQFPDLRAKPCFVIPHGHYRSAYPNTLSKADARERLGLPVDAVVLSHIGVLRPYKNVPKLLAVFRELPDPNLRLLIGGLPGGGLSDEAIRAAAGEDPRIQLHLRRLADEELQVFMNAADLAPLPFTDILNSGSAILALSFDRPILVPRRGSMGELVEIAGTDFVQTYEGDLTAETLRTAVEWAVATPRGRAPLDHLGWDRVAALTKKAYETLRSGGSAANSR